MKHIVVVSLDFYPDDQAASQLFTDLLLRLAGQGMRITVLCGFPPATSPARRERVPRRETVEGIEIVRCGRHLPDKHRLRQRAILYASFLLHAGWKLLRLERNALVFGITSPPFTAHLLWVTSRVAGFSYQYMLLDLYPELLFALGTLTPGSLLGRGWLALNRLSYRRAAALSVIGRDMLPRLQRSYGLDPRQVSYIPHWSPAEVSGPIPYVENPLAHRLGLDGKFVVQYAGNMGLLHDLDTLVRVAAGLRNDERIHFLFVGKGRRRWAAEELGRRLKLSNVTWLDFVPRERLPETLACCHAALISLRRDLAGVAVPSKLYGILGSGRAVLALVPRESEIALVIEEERCGMVIEPDDVAGAVRAIQRLAGDEGLTQHMSDNAFRAYRAKYTLDHAVGAFLRLWEV